MKNTTGEEQTRVSPPSNIVRTPKLTAISHAATNQRVDTNTESSHLHTPLNYRMVLSVHSVLALNLAENPLRTTQHK